MKITIGEEIKGRKSKPNLLRDYAIKIVETGETFYNAWALAEDRHMSITKISKCLKDSRSSYNGLHFELLDPVEAGFDEPKEY